MTDLVERLLCNRCRLADYRTQVVPGVGSPNATLALVGEAPGQQEDMEGVPFVGPAGTMLDQLLGRVGFRRADLFITNVVGCRPPRNDLSAFPDALDQCPKLWLTGEGGELEALPNLRVIVAMGQTAGALWFPGKKAHEIATMNTLIPRYLTTAEEEGMIVVVGSLHPAYALRQGKEAEESIVASLRRALLYLSA